MDARRHDVDVWWRGIYDVFWRPENTEVRIKHDEI